MIALCFVVDTQAVAGFERMTSNVHSIILQGRTVFVLEIRDAGGSYKERRLQGYGIEGENQEKQF